MEEKARTLHRLRSIRYLSTIGILNNLHLPYWSQVSAYILCTSIALPVRTIIVVERPYSTNIHPLASSAMSYDPLKTPPTPSTVGVASDVSRVMKCNYTEVETWFRDSWAHLPSGTVVVNCTLFARYSSSYSSKEIVSFQRWIRSMVECSVQVSSSKIDIVCMGVPAQNVVDAMLGSMGSLRSMVSKKDYPNPAIWSRLSPRDAGSQSYTFGKPGTSKSLFLAVCRSRDYVRLTATDLISHMAGPIPRQLAQVDHLVDKSRTLQQKINDAYKEIEHSHPTPSLNEAFDEFIKAIIAYRDTVVYDIVCSTVASAGDNSSKIGRPAEWGSKSQWKKPPASIGNSSKMSVLSEGNAATEQASSASVGEEISIIQEDEEESPVKEEAIAPVPRPKKTRIVKRMVKKPRQSQLSQSQEVGSEVAAKDVPVGSPITQEQMKDLEYVNYYITDINTKSSLTLQADVRASIETRTVKTAHIATILDTVSMDKKTKNSDVSTSLGLEDGVVPEGFVLPALLAKLTEK